MIARLCGRFLLKCPYKGLWVFYAMTILCETVWAAELVIDWKRKEMLPARS